MGNTTRIRPRLDEALDRVMRAADRKRGTRMADLSELPGMLELARRQTQQPYVDPNEVA